MSNELNPTAASLLGFLHDAPQSGWELTAAVQAQLGGFWSISRSQVHRELRRLAELGFACEGTSGKRDARPYEITVAGRQAFAEWVAKGPDAATVRLPLLLFVSLGRHIDPDVLTGILNEQRQNQAALVREYKAAQRVMVSSGVDSFRLATVEYGITTARATVKWIDDVLASMEP